MLRAFTAADREAYCQMAHDFYRCGVTDHVIPDSHITRTADAVLNGTPFAAIYMLEADGQPVGYSLLALTWSQEGGGDTVWIEELYILPQFRGKGYGTAFFRELQETYPNAVRFRLEVEPDNDGAKALYGRMGFEILNYGQMVLDIG